ncbi:MAG: alpha-N-arabinofuranosidase, partial [Planctomycetes bacterium]|nr:alpha-N-arabinofuranosidase [Planctomycetota bacterium]
MTMPSSQTTLTLHSAFTIDKVDSRIFGGFLEHLGRAVYQGVYDPQCRHADENGLRTDVLGALDRLGMTVMRYPGGNFVSGYHWLDGVGPRPQRPTVRDLAWQSIESNQFGTDEYIALCRRMGWQTMLTVNLGTGTPEEARNWVEYCNCPAGTRFADLRVANGHVQPHGVKLWCLGNEMDGPWQLGHVPADQYAIRAQQTAKMIKDVDSSAELVVCGSCGTGMPTYMEWDRTVLEYMGDLADFVSLHCYVGNRGNDTPNYLAAGQAIDRQIEEMDAACRFVQARRRSRKRAYLCFDEWNVWYRRTQSDGRGQFAPHLLEEVYNLEDALVVAQFLNSFIRHADSVRIANLAQIVNVIAPILTRGDDMLLQSIFYVFEMFSRRRNGVALRTAVSGPTYSCSSGSAVPSVDASAILDDGVLHAFMVNRSDASADLTISLADGSIAGLESAEVVTGPDANSANRYEEPDVVVSRPFTELAVSGGRAVAKLPPLSVSA